MPPRCRPRPPREKVIDRFTAVMDQELHDSVAKVRVTTISKRSVT